MDTVWQAWDTPARGILRGICVGLMPILIAHNLRARVDFEVAESSRLWGMPAGRNLWFLRKLEELRPSVSCLAVTKLMAGSQRSLYPTPTTAWEYTFTFDVFEDRQTCTCTILLPLWYLLNFDTSIQIYFVCWAHCSPSGPHTPSYSPFPSYYNRMSCRNYKL